jgi:hypothetical protein
MYSLIRKIHLYSGLVLAVFILMYFATGFVMIFEPVFKREVESEVKRRIPFDSRPASNPDQLAGLIQEALGVRGQPSVQFRRDYAVVNFIHPGTLTEVRIPNGGDSLFITTRRGNINTTMHQFHRLHGYPGDPAYVLWAFIYDLSCLSMIIFALSGVYLWYKVERRRRAGWLILTGSTLLTATTIIYLMFIS